MSRSRRSGEVSKRCKSTSKVTVVFECPPHAACRCHIPLDVRFCMAVATVLCGEHFRRQSRPGPRGGKGMIAHNLSRTRSSCFLRASPPVSLQGMPACVNGVSASVLAVRRTAAQSICSLFFEGLGKSLPKLALTFPRDVCFRHRIFCDGRVLSSGASSLKTLPRYQQQVFLRAWRL